MEIHGLKAKHDQLSGKKIHILQTKARQQTFLHIDQSLKSPIPNWIPAIFPQPAPIALGLKLAPD
jgi:hypothetical protein